MAKTSGLNTRIYVAGYDISGDASSIDGVGYSQGLMETTSLTAEATSRITGLADGSLSVSVFLRQLQNMPPCYQVVNCQLEIEMF